MQNLLDGQNREYDVLDEPKDNKNLLFVIFIVAILAAIAFAVYYFVTAAPIRQTEPQQVLQNTPLLKPAGPLKRIPENAGGLTIPHQDKQVFETIEEPSPPSPPEPTEASPSAEPAESSASSESQEQSEPAEQVTVLPQPETLIVPEPSTPESEAEPAPSFTGGKLEIIIPPAEPSTPEPSPEEVAEPALSPEEVAESEPSPEPSPESSSVEAEENEDTASQTETQQPVASAETPTSFSVQFAASNSADSAEVIRKDLSQRFVSILSPYGLIESLVVDKAQLSDGAEIFRVQITTLPYNTAREICAKVKVENLDCFVKAEK